MANFFRYFFKFPLYRLIFSIILGVLAFLCIFYIYAHKEGLNYLENLAYIKYIPAGAWILVFFLCFFLGEFLALLGEMILNLFFNFNPLGTNFDERRSFFEIFFSHMGRMILEKFFDYTPPKEFSTATQKETAANQTEDDAIIERLTPFSFRNLTFKDLRKLNNEVLDYTYEYYLIIGRTTAGLALLLFIMGSILLSEEIITILLIDLFIILILFFSIAKSSSINFVLLIFIIIYLNYSFRFLSSHYYDGVLLILLSLLFFISAANYRAFANNLIKYSMKLTIKN